MKVIYGGYNSLSRLPLFIIAFSISILLLVCISCESDSPTESNTTSLTKFSGDCQTGAPGDTLPTLLVVLVTDSKGKAISGQWIDFCVIEGDAVLSDTLVVTNEIGKAETTLILGIIEGEIKVEAKLHNTDIKVEFTAFSNRIYQASISIVGGNNQYVLPEKSLTDSLQVIVKNSRGYTLEGVEVIFNIVEGKGTLSPIKSTTSSSGITKTLFTASNEIGTTRISASISGDISPVEFIVEVMNVPNAPSDLQATSVSTSQIDLSWIDNANNENGFNIESKKADGEYSIIATVDSNVTAFSATELTIDTTYYFRVKAYNAVENSEYSNEVFSKTKGYYNISGTITGATSAKVKLSGDLVDSQIVNSDGGSYSFKIEYGGTYTIKVYSYGYRVIPESYTFTNVQEDQSQDFIAERVSGESIEGVVFVSIPGGTFRMGDIQGGGNSDERPVHDVTLDGFEMSVYEITNAQYAAFLNAALATDGITATSTSVKGARGDFSGLDYFYLDGYECEIDYSDGMFMVESNKEDCAVRYVTWYGAKSFALYYELDLPTEAEWEYVCRAGTETKYYTGNSESDLSRAGWYTRNNGGIHPVGQKEPNTWGLYDMHGNLWEWCHDLYKLYSSNSAIGGRVKRGGGWRSDAWSCRSARRPSGGDHSNPGLGPDTTGFRVVRRPGGVTY